MIRERLMSKLNGNKLKKVNDWHDATLLSLVVSGTVCAALLGNVNVSELLYSKTQLFW